MRLYSQIVAVTDQDNHELKLADKLLTAAKDRYM